MVKLIKRILANQFVRFVLTGGINTLAGYIIYAVVYFFTKNETVALVFDYVLGILINFKTYSFLVFNNRDNKKIFIFAFFYIVVFVLNRLSLYLFIDRLGMNAYLAQIAALTYIPLLLYFSFKKYVFTDS